ncbi:RecX family transcriptional regulator [Vibrio parahaemolyticus]|uniref:RecX family transcriptional regulator n=1 Tax=Vibrio parahaemolyticus TaxID=670 RepID=UPI001EEA7A3A|nr:RecX family transcriptional regulator [Vibrio parahaemolyticus]MCG6459294.1 RecX family transcriptional regulator [Vibrio parahaemolyticus]
MMDSNKNQQELQHLSDFALSFATKHHCSEQELRTSLSYLIPHDKVNQVFAYMIASNVIDDANTIMLVIHQQLEHQQGREHIELSLKKRKFNHRLIRQSLDGLNVDWYQVCKQAKRKQFGERRPEDQKEKLDMLRYLRAKGHQIQDIMVCIEERGDIEI